MSRSTIRRNGLLFCQEGFPRKFDPDFHEVHGEVVRLVWFATNDPTQPWVEVRITADVE